MSKRFHDDADIAAALIPKRARFDISDDGDNDDDALRDFIQTSISKRDIKAGTQVVKNAKGKAKFAKGEVGGGSFQSMGASGTAVDYIRLTPSRVTPVATAISHSARVSNTNTNSKIVHSCSSDKSTQGSCWNGAHWLRQVIGIPDSPRSETRGSTLHNFWCPGVNFTTNT